jgi:MFS family permease
MATTADGSTTSAVGGQGSHRGRTLFLTSVLHAFTHIYQIALMPLYLMIRDDLGLANLDQATLLVTVMMVAYFVPSYPMGRLADRASRKQLLAWGLLINGVGYIALGMSKDFGMALASVVVCGIGGSCFHPAATALVAGLYPEKPGKALGLLGVGASVGFFIGPLYSGWRAQGAGWRLPVMELGWMGVVAAVVFWRFAEEGKRMTAGDGGARERLFVNRKAVLAFVCMALAFSFRDFAGAGNATLSSLYLQKAHGDTVEMAGRALSFVFLASAFGNPIFGHWSDRHRLWWAAGLALVAAASLAWLPYVGHGAFPYAMMFFGFFLMATYPVVEAALMQAVPASIRASFFGLFITIGGLLGNGSHWLVGRWVEAMGTASRTPETYRPLYGVLAALLALSVVGLPCLRSFARNRPGALGDRGAKL